MQLNVGSDGLTIAEKQFIQDKILHTLKVYPVISPSMLQVGIGNHIAASMWRPILELLIVKGIVFEDEYLKDTPKRMNYPHTRLSLEKLNTALK